MEILARSLKLCSFSRLLRSRPSWFRCLASQASPASDCALDRDLAHSFNEDIKQGGVVPVFRRALLWRSRAALHDDLGLYTYGELHRAARLLARDISKQLAGETKTTVAYLCGSDASHTIVQWAIWMSGNIAVPLTSLHPPPLLSYLIADSAASLVICAEQHRDTLAPVAAELKRPLLVVSRGRQIEAQVNQDAKDAIEDEGQTNDWYGTADAMLIYTSGTTNKPKGVVWSHSAWMSQVCALHQAWRYSARDVVLHALPLHHVHGQLNSLNATLAAGARIIMLPSFAAHAVWARLLGMNEKEDSRVTVFHGVPAMYSKLVSEHERLFPQPRTREYVRATLAGRVRLMCCGSAPLPETLLRQWQEISGHVLLERYGMTEVGMALSNSYLSVSSRTPGCVGLPLPGVSARIATDGDRLTPHVSIHTAMPNTQISLEQLGFSPEMKDLHITTKPSHYDWQPSRVERHVESDDGVYQGELLLKGAGVFKRYWNRAPEIASKDFTEDGWFRTGDTASFSENRFKILGRTSVDIIKTGGYKVSAIEIESILLNHPNIADAGVVGIPDTTWGEKVCAAVTLKGKIENISTRELKEWGKDKMAPYQLPSAILVLETMPRNHMGKLDKKAIGKLFASPGPKK